MNLVRGQALCSTHKSVPELLRENRPGGSSETTGAQVQICPCDQLHSQAAGPSQRASGLRGVTAEMVND